MAASKTGPKARIDLDPEQVEALAGIGCTYKEMAAFFKCSIDTLQNKYQQAIELGRENGKASVRRMMWDQGKKGNSTALKYLVHNILKEKIEDYSSKFDNNPHSQLIDKLSEISTETILKLVKDAETKAS